MDMPNFKDILGKLSVFKNNIPLLMSVIIALVAVLLLIPTRLMSSKLKDEIQTKSIEIGEKIQREIENPVSGETWKLAQVRQQEHVKDANEIAALAERSTQRELLSYDIFLDPNIFSTLVFQEFGQRYRSALDGLLNRANAGNCPTEAEIERDLEDSAVNSRLRRGRSSMMDGYPSMTGGRSMVGGRSRSFVRPSPGMSSRGTMGRSRIKSELEGMIVDEICEERAKSISVYANPTDLCGYDFWGEDKYSVKIEEATEDCWYFQLAYWAIEDIFDSISTVNSKYDNVLTSPVKHFTQMSFNMGVKRPGAAGGVYTGRNRRRSATRSDRDDIDKPIYVLSVDEGLTESCTGRFSNEDIDVIHFNFSVILKMESILQFIQELCSAKEHKFRGFSGKEQEQTFKHNQITVLETKFRFVEDDPYSLYCYGDNVVVELDLVCEYIFNKKGYEEIKPEVVKNTLLGEGETTGR